METITKTRNIYPHHNLAVSEDINPRNFNFFTTTSRSIFIRNILLRYKCKIRRITFTEFLNLHIYSIMIRTARELMSNLSGEYYNFKDVYCMFDTDQFWTDDGLFLWKIVGVKPLSFRYEMDNVYYHFVCKVAIKND